MRTRLVGLAVTASLLWIGGASRTEAQYVVSRGYTSSPRPYSGVTVVGSSAATAPSAQRNHHPNGHCIQ